MAGNAITWDALRREAVARGQITEEGVQQARAEQDAYEAEYEQAQVGHVGVEETRGRRFGGGT
ncbi:hypothetical protein BJF85_11565 [Saccharomonospora sp. CUA-673]|uniref:hypothetical protein n=1 Tax=Saccharomonospora sp. CUA-673 TaxID=1904969 RepID=UPI00096433CD|nr:hypothetical protein [Saccharomonospora sp. CUA-673]OLT48758.1 hypothetical protein BJF85_11565 [Saccharomonospora sp. CUA-673]